MKSLRPSYQEQSDELLMQQIAGRNERAFAVLYDRYSARMHRYFYRMLWRDAAKAEDFTQELFLKIIEKPQRYNPARPFRTWIYAVASNMCKNEFRRKTPDQPDWEESGTESLDHYLPERLDHPAFEYALREAIDGLGAAHKPCFVLRFQEELSVPEIAAILDCPEGTVKSRLHYALLEVSGRMTIFKH